MNNATMEVPPMKSEMMIMHLELVKEAPAVMGLMQDKNKDIFKAICYPVTMLEGHQNGWKKLHDLELDDKEDFADRVAEEFGSNMDAFRTEIPMTRHTVELNRYEPGKKIKVMVSQIPVVGDMFE